MGGDVTAISIIDAIFLALVAGDRAALGHIQRERADECVDVRAVLSTPDPGGVALDLELGTTSNIYVTPFFEGPRAFFLSKQTSTTVEFAGRSGVWRSVVSSGRLWRRPDGAGARATKRE